MTIKTQPHRAPGGFAIPVASPGSLASMRPLFGRVFHDTADSDTGNPGGGAGDEGGEGDDQRGDAGKKKVELSPEAQAVLNAAVDAAIARNDKKWQGKYKALEDKLNAKEHPAPGKDGKGDDKGEKTVPKSEFDSRIADLEKKHKDELDIASKRIETLLIEKKTDALKNAAIKLGAVNEEQVALLAGGRVAFDEDGALVVMKPDGSGLQYGSKGEPMTVEEYLGEYLGANKHLLRPNFAGGAGSGTGTGGGRSGKGPHKPEIKTDADAVSALADAFANLS